MVNILISQYTFNHGAYILNDLPKGECFSGDIPSGNQLNMKSGIYDISNIRFDSLHQNYLYLWHKYFICDTSNDMFILFLIWHWDWHFDASKTKRLLDIDCYFYLSLIIQSKLLKPLSQLEKGPFWVLPPTDRIVDKY